MAWPNRGLKDMTSMSGLRQCFPQENAFGLSNTPGAHGARRIVCASRHPPRPLEAWSLETWSLEAWKRLARGLEEAWSTSWEWSWELKFHEKCLPGGVLAAQATKVACKGCQEEGKEGQGGPKDDQIDTPNGPKTLPKTPHLGVLEVIFGRF